MTMANPANTTDSNFRRVASVAIFLLLVTGGVFAYEHFTSVYHLAVVQPDVLYRDGARSVDELKRAIARVHPKTVVCLVEDQHEMNDPAKPQFKEEAAFLESARPAITMERIPVKLGGYPTTADVRRFLMIATDPARQPVLVHCAQGVRRTAMMVASFQESELGYTPQRAKDEIITFGHSESTIDDIRRFIDAYDAKSQTVADELIAKK